MCKKNSTDLIKIIIHVLLAVVFVLNFKIIRVNGQSMSPTLDNGQVILTSRHTDDLKRNSIVIVKYNDELIVKRIAALENDTVVMKDDAVFVSGIKHTNSRSEGEDM